MKLPNRSPTKFFMITALLIVAAFFTTVFPLQSQYKFVSSVFVILFALPCYYGLLKSFGWKKTAAVIVVMSLFALGLENLAVTSGIPYGKFEYEQLIGSTIGKVPWTVGFAWTPILFGTAAITQAVHPTKPKWQQVVIIVLMMTSLDLILDPGSVALGFWKWQHPVGFYGVPWSNFGGWILTSGTAAIILMVLLKVLRVSDKPWSNLTYSSFILMLIYWTAVCFFFQLWGAVVLGLGILAWLSRKLL